MEYQIKCTERETDGITQILDRIPGKVTYEIIHGPKYTVISMKIPKTKKEGIEKRLTEEKPHLKLEIPRRGP